MLDGAVKVIGDKRAAKAGGVPVRREHQVVDEQLAAAFEKFSQSFSAGGRIVVIVLFDFDPGQCAALGGERVAIAQVPFLFGQQFLAGGEPRFARNDRVRRQWFGFCCCAAGSAHDAFSFALRTLRTLATVFLPRNILTAAAVTPPVERTPVMSSAMVA